MKQIFSTTSAGIHSTNWVWINKAALDAAVGPVHVHCIMNWRVSAFFYLLNRANGMDENEARSIMARQWDPISSENPAAAPWRAMLMATTIG